MLIELEANDSNFSFHHFSFTFLSILRENRRITKTTGETRMSKRKRKARGEEEIELKGRYF